MKFRFFISKAARNLNFSRSNIHIGSASHSGETGMYVNILIETGVPIQRTFYYLFFVLS